MLRQKDFTSATLVPLLTGLLMDPARLQAAAEAAASLGRQDAARVLADLVEARLTNSRDQCLHSASAQAIPGTNREIPA
jgi:UDP-N-acetylglucosamine--N-acetylmuramyl-(pentapeptide) pyrophosphoryl-undecaprenol N-acetylglucosamine transferase